MIFSFPILGGKHQLLLSLLFVLFAHRKLLRLWQNITYYLLVRSHHSAVVLFFCLSTLSFICDYIFFFPLFPGVWPGRVTSMQTERWRHAHRRTYKRGLFSLHRTFAALICSVSVVNSLLILLIRLFMIPSAR